MKIFSTNQIRKADEFTIQNEPITSGNLMERAAQTCTNWIISHFEKKETVHLFCGNGNNGGDGFAIARLLYQKGLDVNIFHDQENMHLSADAQINLTKANDISGIDFFDFNEVEHFQFKENSVMIDALFGTGLSRSLKGKNADLIQKLNDLNCAKIAIDIPSGLFADTISSDSTIIFKADHTLSFQFWKKSFLHPETGKYCGKIHILNIGLSSDFIVKEYSENFVIDDSLIKEIYQPRNDFSHKGNFGKTVIVAGSFGKIGAAVLATKAALKSGSGITMTLAPKCGYEILQTTCPEAMFLSNGDDFLNEFPIEEEEVVGIGPGLGTNENTEKALLQFLENYKKSLVVDADALNILAKNPKNLEWLPKNSVITPHPKEFERLFGETKNSFERLELALKKAEELEIIIVLKDHHTQIITPQNEVFYNITGNSGMAKGGSGDALLGIISSLLAQNYSPKKAAIFGVWMHGKAGDFVAEKFSREAMLPTDLIDELRNVFKYLK